MRGQTPPLLAIEKLIFGTREQRRAVKMSCDPDKKQIACLPTFNVHGTKTYARLESLESPSLYAWRAPSRKEPPVADEVGCKVSC
jgi:hypothetical protein